MWNACCSNVWYVLFDFLTTFRKLKFQIFAILARKWNKAENVLYRLLSIDYEMLYQYFWIFKGIKMKGLKKKTRNYLSMADIFRCEIRRISLSFLLHRLRHMQRTSLKLLARFSPCSTSVNVFMVRIWCMLDAWCMNNVPTIHSHWQSELKSKRLHEEKMCWTGCFGIYVYAQMDDWLSL